MLCELPAVVTNVGDLSDLVKDGDNGCLIGEPHAENLIRCLRTLFGKPERIDAMGRAARVKAEQLSIGSVSRQWEQHLADL